MVQYDEPSAVPTNGHTCQGWEEDRAASPGTDGQPPRCAKPLKSQIQIFFQDVNWAKSAAGPIADWDTELRHISRFLLADTSPAVLFWGDSSAVLYNEAYLPFLGQSHPEAMGMDASDIFTPIWSQLAGVISEQRRTGRTETCTGTMLLVKRNGRLRETYFDWKLIPVTDDDGEVKGSYGIPLDRTQEVICSRQNDCIQRLSRHTGTASNMRDLWHTLLAGLSHDNKDIPFALLYSLDERLSISAAPSKPSYPCHLEGTIGVDTDRAIGQEYIDLSCDKEGFAPTMLKALKSDSMLILHADDPSLHKLLDGTVWQRQYLPCEQFAIVPIKDDGRIVALMVVGLNPHRECSEQFCEFLQLIADVTAPQVSRARLSEEVSRHNELAKRAQLDRRRSEMRFSRFAEWSIVGLAVTDVQGKILYANDAWYKFFGLSPAEQENLSWLDSVVPEDVNLLLEWQKKVLDEKKGGTFQIRSKEPFRRGHMYSDHRTGICACYSDLNESDGVDSIVIFTMDISELKWTEQQLISRTKALEESEKKWRNYAEHCPLGICRTDGQGYVQYGNNAWHSFYGFGPDDGDIPNMPQPWLPWVRNECVQPCEEFFAKLQQSPGIESVEFQLVDKTYTISGGDNTVTNGAYVSATGFSEFKDDGTVDHIDFWVTDISGQKMAVKVLTDKMEEAIRSKTQQERFMDMISHEIRNPLSAVLHCSEEIIDSIKRGSATLEWAFDDLPNSHSTSCARDILEEQIRNALDAAHTISYCVQHQKQIVDDVLTVSKLDSDMLVVAPVPVQPMTLVRSSLKIFNAELRMGDIRLTVIEDDSLSALGLDWVLLDPSRFLQIVINLVTNAIKFTKKSKVREITVTASALAHRPFESDLGVEFVPQRYAPATPASAVSLDTGLKNAGDPLSDIFLCFCVKDTGKGMTEDEKTQVFDRFAQASPKTHVEYGGSGLGLFISRQLTEMLGGEIGMDGRPGSGCTFAFYVKARRCELPKSSPKSSEPVIRLSRSLSLTANGTPVPLEDGIGEVPPIPDDLHDEARQIRVLVVEDNLVNQKILCKQLRNHDFVVQAANHGRDALDVVRHTKIIDVPDEKGPFDVILCDIEMPVMDGIEFTKEIRRLEVEGELAGHIPILGVTANVRGKQLSGAIEVGMDGVTTKPYRIEELITHIRGICAK
ncbi:uncharacterized protein F4822DRAFT_358381 [Hypoxylon trugodes]|uniref:uncharacterized protein n=1 Tax=Hypoxylon trugodes TaxID=326681 RepID=UPI00218C9CEB|nr:uncharacterized protein F4822DRAFT_358381 [Hypoxylon trugodes]KAI1385947.1 hypothetical protein F4822DRAFT_358381 [Hypoxylon trugodes]